MTERPSTVRLVESLLYDANEMSPEDTAAASVFLLDFLGVAIAGAGTAEGRTVLQTMETTEAPGPCGVPVSGRRFAPATAALVTGTMGYSIGLTDTHSASITHPGPSIIPAALAVGEAVGASPGRVLAAIVLGVDLVIRVGAAVNPSHRTRGFHPTATCNHFGAALAASYLLGSSIEQTVSAIGIAGSMAGGLYEFRQSGSMLMALHGGWPAHGGVQAAYLAANGFTGPSTVLEGPEGFLHAFADSANPEHLNRSPGEPWLIHEISLRPYCACRYAHAAIDALAHINARRPTAPSEITRMTVWTHRTAIDQETEPTTLVSARLCTKFTIALAAVYGARLTEITEADLRDESVLALMDRIDLVEDPTLTAAFPRLWSCRVRINRTDGTSDEQQVDIPKGDPANPMTDDEIDVKFIRLVEPTLGTAPATTLLAALRKFEQLTPADLWPLMMPGGGA